jgi:hypothetical protein
MGLFSKLFGKEEEPQKKYVPQGDKVTFVNDEKPSKNIEHTMEIKVEAPKQEYIIKKDGEYLVFKTKEEMPEDIRAGVEELEEAERVNSSYTVIIDGKRQTYPCIEDMPDDVREAFTKSSSD